MSILLARCRRLDRPRAIRGGGGGLHRRTPRRAARRGSAASIAGHVALARRSSRELAADRRQPPRIRSVVDGQHRVAAAELPGLAAVAGGWFDGSPEDAFVEFVRCNVGHGLALAWSERRVGGHAGSCVTHPERSDRGVASVCGRLAQDRRPGLRARPRTRERRRDGPARDVSAATGAQRPLDPRGCVPASPRSSSAGRTRRCGRSPAPSGFARDGAQRAREAPSGRAADRDPEAEEHDDTEATVLGLLTRSGRPGTGWRATRRSAAVSAAPSSSSGSTPRLSTRPTSGRMSARCRGAGSTRWPTRPAVAPASGAASPTRWKASSAAAPSSSRRSRRHPSEDPRMPKVDLPYAINDADNHFNEPPDCTSGTSTRRSGPGDPLRHRPRRSRAAAVRRAALEVRLRARSRTPRDELRRCSATRRTSAPAADDAATSAEEHGLPGMLLNRLNPLKGLSDDEREAFDRRVPRASRGLRQPRPAPGADGRAGHRQGADVPGERARHRVRVRRRHRSALRQHPGVQPLDPRGDRVRVRGPHVPAAVPRARRRRPRGRTSSRRHARQGDADDPDQVRPRARRAPTTRSVAVPSPTRSSTRSGHVSTRPACGSRCTSAAPTTRSTAPTGARTPRSPSATSTRSSG